MIDFTVDIKSTRVGDRRPSAYSENNFSKALGVFAHCNASCLMRDLRTVCKCMSLLELEVEISKCERATCFAVMWNLFNSGGADTRVNMHHFKSDLLTIGQFSQRRLCYSVSSKNISAGNKERTHPVKPQERVLPDFPVLKAISSHKPKACLFFLSLITGTRMLCLVVMSRHPIIYLFTTIFCMEFQWFGLVSIETYGQLQGRENG